MDDLTPYPCCPAPLSRARTESSARTESASYRVGEAERSAACDALAEHYAAGRLDPAELDDRLARAMAARSRGDLHVLFADLAPRRPVPAPTPAEPVKGEPARAGSALPLAASIMIIALLIAGGMLLALGTYAPILCAAALAGGTATGVAGACATVLLQGMFRHR